VKSVIEKLPPALKHGGYSAMSVLPGESAAEFEKLHQALVAEWGVDGELEADTIVTMARAIWRKRNLATLRLARIAQWQAAQLQLTVVAGVGEQEQAATGQVSQGERDLIERCNNAEQQARRELGEFYGLVEMGEEVTFDQFLRELQVFERLDALIDRCVKRLLQTRGLRSLMTAPDLSE
jgi:hypothetical protein